MKSINSIIFCICGSLWNICLFVFIICLIGAGMFQPESETFAYVTFGSLGLAILFFCITMLVEPSVSKEIDKEYKEKIKKSYQYEYKPRIYHYEPKPSFVKVEETCKGCGAPLKGCTCDYCGRTKGNYRKIY